MTSRGLVVWVFCLLVFLQAATAPSEAVRLSVLPSRASPASSSSNPPPPSDGSSAPQDNAQGSDGSDNPMQRDFTPCKTCIYVLEQIKSSPSVLLPSICSQIYLKFPESYTDCHQVLNSLAVNSPNVRQWLLGGCYKQEVYGAKSWISPCPSHVICAALKNLQDLSYCPVLPAQNPFQDEETAAAVAAAS